MRGKPPLPRDSRTTPFLHSAILGSTMRYQALPTTERQPLLVPTHCGATHSSVWVVTTVSMLLQQSTTRFYGSKLLFSFPPPHVARISLPSPCIMPTAVICVCLLCHLAYVQSTRCVHALVTRAPFSNPSLNAAHRIRPDLGFGGLISSADLSARRTYRLGGLSAGRKSRLIPTPLSSAPKKRPKVQPDPRPAKSPVYSFPPPCTNTPIY